MLTIKNVFYIRVLSNYPATKSAIFNLVYLSNTHNWYRMDFKNRQTGSNFARKGHPVQLRVNPTLSDSLREMIRMSNEPSFKRLEQNVQQQSPPSPSLATCLTPATDAMIWALDEANRSSIYRREMLDRFYSDGSARSLVLSMKPMSPTIETFPLPSERPRSVPSERPRSVPITRPRTKVTERPRTRFTDIKVMTSGPPESKRPRYSGNNPTKGCYKAAKFITSPTHGPSQPQQSQFGFKSPCGCSGVETFTTRPTSTYASIAARGSGALHVSPVNNFDYEN